MATLRLLIDAGGARRGAGEFEGAASRVDRAARRTAVQMGATSKATGGFRASLLSLRTALVALPALFTAVGGAATLAFGKKLVSVASDAEETGDKFRVLFEGVEAQAEAAAARTADLFGRSVTDVKDYQASIANLLIPLGFLPDEVQKTSDALSRLAIDFASLNNKQDQEAVTAILSAIAGETEPLRRLGVTLNENKIQQEALALGINKTSKEMTDQEKTVARLSIIFREADKSIGNAVLTQDSYANQLKRLQGGVQDLAAAFGAELIVHIKEAVAELGGSERVLNLVRVGMRFVTEASKVMVTTIAETADIALRLIDALGGVAVANFGMTGTAKLASSAIRDFGTAVEAAVLIATSSFDILSNTIKANLLVIERDMLTFAHGLQKALLFGAEPFGDLTPKIRELSEEIDVAALSAGRGMAEAMQKLAVSMASSTRVFVVSNEEIAKLKEQFDELIASLSSGVGATGRAETPGQAIKRDLEGAFTPLEDAILRARELREVLFSIAQGILSSIIQSTITRPIGQAVSSAIFGSAQGNAFSAGNIIPFASGGILGGPHMFPLAGGRLGLAGEAGPEAVMPLARTPNGDLGVKAASSGSPDVVSAIREQTRIIARAFGGGGGLGLSARQAQRRG